MSAGYLIERCLIEGCFLVGFARDFGYVMRLRCAIVLNSRDGFEEMCPSICRVTRKEGEMTKRSREKFENKTRTRGQKTREL